MKVLALVAIAACTRPAATVVIREPVTAREQMIRVPVPCISTPPPPEPVDWCEGCPLPTGIHGTVINCDGLSWEDCNEITNAAWSDYGKELGVWVKTNAWPRCQDLR